MESGLPSSEAGKSLKHKAMKLHLGDRLFLVEVEYQRRKSISLSLKSTEELYVKAPAGYPDEKIREFVSSKRRWVEKRMDSMEQSDRAGVGSGITDGRTLYYLGKPRILEVSGTRVVVTPERITVPQGFTEQDLEEWYRRQSHGIVIDFIERNKAALPGCTFKIRRQKRIWGSCNTKRNININSRISMCRPSAIEYVLWHEICHLRHMDHSPRFYGCLEKVFPGYREEKKWLKDHGYLLTI